MLILCETGLGPSDMAVICFPGLWLITYVALASNAPSLPLTARPVVVSGDQGYAPRQRRRGEGGGAELLLPLHRFEFPANVTLQHC